MGIARADLIQAGGNDRLPGRVPVDHHLFLLPVAPGLADPSAYSPGWLRLRRLSG